MLPELHLQPLQPHDAAQVQEFVRQLSPQSCLNRYFAPIRELTPRQLERVTNPASANDVSVGAFEPSGRLVAIAQCAAVDGTAEFGVVVADDWQGSGLGRRLMEHLLSHGQRRGLSCMHGLVRARNRAMLHLAAGLGFRAARDEDPDLIRVERSLAHA